jgi:hypothetical protein
MEDGKEPWAAERSIKARLMHHKIIDDVDGVRPEAFVLVAAKLGDFKRCPVTNQDMAKLKKQGGKQTDDRKNLNLAADILTREIEQGRWRSFPAFKERVCRWEEAIVVLRMPRGAVDNPNDWLDGAKPGQPMQPWSYMATEIAEYTLQALRPFRPSVSLRHDSGMVKFVREALEFIGVNKLPARATLSALLRKNLARTGILDKRTGIPQESTGAKKPGVRQTR